MRIVYLLIALAIIINCPAAFAQKPAVLSYNVCCPPVDKMELAKQFTPIDANKPPYRLKFTPSVSFRNKLQAYTNYLYSLYPRMESLSQTWQIFDAGTGIVPSKTTIADILPRNDGSAQNDCLTEFRPGNTNEIIMNPAAGLFPQRLQAEMWYTVKLLFSTSEGQGNPSHIPADCREISFSYKVKLNNGVVTVIVSNENNILKEFNVMPDRCMDYNDRSQQSLSNWKQNGNVSSITYQVEPGEHKFYIRFLDDDKESIVFNNADFRGNWLTMYGNKCMCFDYRIKYELSVDPNASYVPYLFIYTGNKNLENTGNSWNSGLLFAKFISNYNNVNNQWKHYCLPLNLCKGRLPFNEYGRWQIDRADSCAAWDSILTHVTGLIIPTDYNRAPTEEISFDNFCTINCDNPGDGIPVYPACCPPLDKAELAGMLNPLATTSLNAPYKLQFTPATGFNNRMSAFTSYLDSLYPGLELYSSWQMFDAGSAAMPVNTSVSSVFEDNDSSVLTKRTLPPLLQPGKWYTIKFRLTTSEGKGTPSRIAEDCSSATLSYRVQIINGLKKITIVDGNKILKGK